MGIKKLHIGFLVFITLLMTSCGTGKYFQDEETLLTKNKINWVDNEKINNKTLLTLELEGLYRQSPNNNFFWFFPREWFYLSNAEPQDTGWFDNFRRNNIGEPPAVYSMPSTQETASNMEQFLKNKRGFYNAEVSYDVSQNRHMTEVTYNIKTGTQYTVNEIEYLGYDSTIVDIIKSVSDKSIIRKGDPLDDGSFSLEKTRIITELQDRGYSSFSPNHLDIKGDSSNMNHTVDVFFEVYPPLPEPEHKLYRIGSINVYTDFFNGQNLAELESYTDEKGIKYYRRSSDFLVNPSTIGNRIYLTPGELMSKNSQTKTLRKLNELGTYRFVSPTARLSAEGDTLVDFNIMMTPQDYKWISDIGADINYSNVSTTTSRQLFGFSVNGQLTNRNLFGGSEQNTISASNGYEFNLDDRGLSTFSLSIQNSLEVPKYIDFLKTGRLFNKLNFIGDNQFKNIQEETETSFNLGYNLIDILDFYKINSFNLSLGYNYTPNSRHRVSWTQAGISLFNFDVRPRFIESVQDADLILKSFEDNLTTGFLLNTVGYRYTPRANPVGSSYSFIAGLEFSGLEIYGLNSLYNLVTGSENTWKLNNQFSFAKFIKLEIDARYNKNFSPRSSLAFRFNSGIAVPLAGQVVPFIKQFSVGGPNSMRAWDQRELGPGSYIFPNANMTTNFFQQGDIKLEFNLEYRFDVAWIIEGALFSDIGNVWSLKNDPGRPGAKFTTDFLDQMAIGAGWGIRWDFTYFNIRFDFGYRIRNPYPLEEQGRQWFTWDEIKAQKFGNLQVAVNYPF